MKCLRSANPNANCRGHECVVCLHKYRCGEPHKCLDIILDIMGYPEYVSYEPDEEPEDCLDDRLELARDLRAYNCDDDNWE